MTTDLTAKKWKISLEILTTFWRTWHKKWTHYSKSSVSLSVAYDDVIKWKYFPRYWPFVRGIHRWPVNSPHKGQWRGAWMFSLIFAWIKLSKQRWGWWFETPSRPSWRHCDDIIMTSWHGNTLRITGPFFVGNHRWQVGSPHKKPGNKNFDHYSDATMGTIASQITSLTIVYSALYSDADQREHQSSASLAFVQGIHRWPVNSPHKWPVTRKMFPFDDVIM